MNEKKVERDLFGLPLKKSQKTDEFFSHLSEEKFREKKPVINLSNVRKIYGGEETETRALNGVNLEIRKGEFVVIMGASGSGKTTLLNVIGLLDRPSEGKYEMNGKDFSARINSRKRAITRGKNIGFIFQDYNLIDSLNVIDNVALPLQYSSRKPNFVNETKASKILAKFNMNSKEYYMPNQLSGGQRQRVAIARSLANEPSIILADEPTGSLDSENSTLIMEEFSRIHADGNTILMVTHNPDLLQYGSRAIYMKDGKIAKDIELTENTAYKISRKTDESQEEAKNSKKKKRIIRKKSKTKGVKK